MCLVDILTIDSYGEWLSISSIDNSLNNLAQVTLDRPSINNFIKLMIGFMYDPEAMISIKKPSQYVGGKWYFYEDYNVLIIPPCQLTGMHLTWNYGTVNAPDWVDSNYPGENFDTTKNTFNPHTSYRRDIKWGNNPSISTFYNDNVPVNIEKALADRYKSLGSLTFTGHVVLTYNWTSLLASHFPSEEYTMIALAPFIEFEDFITKPYTEPKPTDTLPKHLYGNILNNIWNIYPTDAIYYNNVPRVFSYSPAVTLNIYGSGESYKPGCKWSDIMLPAWNAFGIKSYIVPDT